MKDVVFTKVVSKKADAKIKIVFMGERILRRIIWRQKMADYKITARMHLQNIISESREVAQALNEFADKLEQIEKKYTDKEQTDGNSD